MWQDPEVIAACQAEDMGRLIALWRAHPARRVRITQRDLAKALKGYSQGAISRIESGESEVTRLADLRWWARMIDLPVYLSWFGGPTQPVRDGLWQKLTWTPAADLPDGAAEEPTARARRPLTPVPLLAHPRAGHTQVEQLRQETRRIRLADHAYGADRVCGQAVASYNRGSRYLRSAPSGPLLNDLLPVMAEVGACTGWILLEAGDPLRARWHLLEAMHLARQGGSAEAYVHALVNLASMAQLLGAHQYGLSFVALAHRAATQLASCKVSAHFLFSEATFHAAIGDRRSALRALSRAHTRLGRGGGDNDPAWIQFLTERAAHVATARTLAAVGDKSSTLDAVAAAERIDQEGFERNNFRLNVELMTIALTFGDFDRVYAAAPVVATSGLDVEGKLVDDCVQKFLTRLAAIDSPRAREISGRWRQLFFGAQFSDSAPMVYAP